MLYVLIKVTNNIPKLIASSADRDQVIESSFKRIERFIQRPLTDEERQNFQTTLFFEDFNCDPTTFTVLVING